MELLTRSNNKDWDRMVYLKVLYNQEAIHSINDDKTCKLILIKEGTGIIHCNSREAFLVAPSVFCLNHKESISFEENHSFKLMVLFFQTIALNDQLNDSVFYPEFYQEMSGTTLYQDLYLLSSFYEINDVKRQHALLDATSFIILKQLLDKVNEELISQKDDFWPCRSRSYFIQSLFFLESLHRNEVISNSSVVLKQDKNQLVHNITQYLSQHIDKKITLEELEKKFACNRNQINIEFQKQLNTTVMHYFVQLRMQLANTLLRDTEIPIQEVALRVGYSDAAYFSRTFKRYLTLTPSECRNGYASTL